MLRRDAACSRRASGSGGREPYEVASLSRHTGSSSSGWSSAAVLPVLARVPAQELLPRALAPVRRSAAKTASSTRLKQSQRARVRDTREVTVAEEQLSYLQRASVRPRTRTLYSQAWEELIVWCRLMSMSFSTEQEMERSLLDYFDHLFFEGAHHSKGSRVLTAVLFFRPEWSRQRGQFLVKTRQALRGWAKLTPSMSRLPTPWEVICLICRLLVREGNWHMAAAVLMCAVFYFRPSEALQLQVCQLVPPLLNMHHSHRRWTVILHPMELGQPSKTNQWDDSRILDLEDHKFLEKVLAALVKNRKETEQVFPFTYSEWAASYRRAGIACQLECLGPPTLYGLRHAGASIDVALGRRSLPEVQQRGNWVAPASVRRYQKGGRLTEQLLHLEPGVRKQAQRCAETIGAIMNE